MIVHAVLAYTNKRNLRINLLQHHAFHLHTRSFPENAINLNLYSPTGVVNKTEFYRPSIARIYKGWHESLSIYARPTGSNFSPISRAIFSIN